MRGAIQREREELVRAGGGQDGEAGAALLSQCVRPGIPERGGHEGDQGKGPPAGAEEKARAVASQGQGQQRQAEVERGELEENRQRGRDRCDPEPARASRLAVTPRAVDRQEREAGHGALRLEAAAEEHRQRRGRRHRQRARRRPPTQRAPRQIINQPETGDGKGDRHQPSPRFMHTHDSVEHGDQPRVQLELHFGVAPGSLPVEHGVEDVGALLREVARHRRGIHLPPVVVVGEGGVDAIQAQPQRQQEQRPKKIPGEMISCLHRSIQ